MGEKEQRDLTLVLCSDAIGLDTPALNFEASCVALIALTHQRQKTLEFKMKSKALAQILGVDSLSKKSISPRAQLELLLDAEDPLAAVEALSSVTFYELYHALGPNDADDLLALATPEHVQTALDFDVWRDDTVDDNKLSPWVEQLLALPDDRFKLMWSKLAPEVTTLYMHRNLNLYSSEDRNDEVVIPEGESENVAQSPDFTYWIAYPRDPDKAELLRRLVDRLYAVYDVEGAWSMLETMQWELATDLEETAYRFRTERLREFGYMPKHEAAAIFARVDHVEEAEALRQLSVDPLRVYEYPTGNRIHQSLVRLADHGADDTYLAQILATLDDVSGVKIQLLSLGQRIASIDGYEPHEVDGLEESMLLAFANVNIGLEYSSKRDDDLAKQLLLGAPLRRLFTLGHNLLIELQNKAKTLIAPGHLSIIEDDKMSLLTASQRDIIEGLLCERPRPSALTLTPFLSANDIAMAAACIADIATRELFFGEAIKKTRDDIAHLAYTHDLPIGVENVNFDNVAVTYLSKRAIFAQDCWDAFTLADLPSRDTVLGALSADAILALFPKNLPQTVVTTLERFAAQLRAGIENEWAAGMGIPEPQHCQCLLIEADDLDF